MSEHTYQPDFYGAGFHWREGLCFKRLDNGDVQFSIREHPTAVRAGMDYHGEPGDHHPTWIIPAMEWVSIIASVSAAGSAIAYPSATAFHGSPSIEAITRAYECAKVIIYGDAARVSITDRLDRLANAFEAPSDNTNSALVIYDHDMVARDLRAVLSELRLQGERQ